MSACIVSPAIEHVHAGAAPALSWARLSRAERDELAVRVPFVEGGTIELPVFPNGLLAVPFGYALARIVPTEGACRG
jgi:hypothetical protein